MMMMMMIIIIIIIIIIITQPQQVSRVTALIDNPESQKHWLGCAAQFPKPLPAYLRPDQNFDTLFMTFH